MNTEIAKLPPRLLSGLTITEQTYLNRYLAKRVSQIEDKQLFDLLRNLVKTAMLDLDSKDVGDTETYLNLSAQSWMDKLHLTSPNTPIEEIKAAVQLGLSGKLAPHFGKVSTTKFMEWLSEYQASNERAVAIRKYRENEKKMEVTQKQKDETFNEALQFSRDHYKKTGVILDAGNALFHRLWKDGKIRFQKEVADEYLNRAAEIVNREDEIELKKARESLDKTTVGNIMQKMASEFETGERAKSEACKLALKDYFNKS